MSNTISLSNIEHPLDHCEAAKAYYYAWVATTVHPPGSNAREAAHQAYRKHWKECEVCIEEGWVDEVR